MEDEEVTVQADPSFKKKKLSFWGRLSDAFLMQGGAKPINRERVQRENVAAAMKPIGTDPDLAIRNLLRVDAPDEALKLYTTNQDDKRLEAESQARVAINRQKIQDGLITRAAAFLGAANKDTYPAIRKRVLADFQNNDMEVPYDLPETYDDALANTWRLTGVAPKDQQIIEDRRENNEMMESGRNSRNRYNQEQQNGRTSMQISAGNSRAAAARAAAMDRQKEHEFRTDRRFLYRYKHALPRAGGAAPAEGTRKVVNGKTYVIKNGKVVAE